MAEWKTQLADKNKDLKQENKRYIERKQIKTHFITITMIFLLA